VMATILWTPRKGLQGLDVGEQAPARGGLEQLLFETGETIDLLVDGVERLLKDDLLRGVGQTILDR